MDIKSLLSFARENECAAADVLYSDLRGRLRRVGIPLQHFSADAFEKGITVDEDPSGQKLVLVPDSSTAKLDPFAKARTLAMLGEVKYSQTLLPHPLDPRAVAKRASTALKESGIAETARIGARVQFFFFDDVRFDHTKASSFHIVESVEGPWNTGREENPNLGYKGQTGEGANIAAPFDAYADLRQEVAGELIKMGIAVESERKGPASAGQGEISLKAASLAEMADNIVWLKYILRNAAIRNQKTATFMPCPIEGEPQSLMPLSISLWNGQKNLFAENNKAAESFRAGLARFAAPLCSFLRPTVNSYRATKEKNMEWLALNAEGESLCCKIADPSSNPYLALSAILCAGMAGEAEKKGAASRKTILASDLASALRSLRAQKRFLTAKGVFGEELLAAWIKSKEETELPAFAARPTPLDFSLYFNL